MTIASAEQFLNQLINDPHFRDQFKNATSPDTMWQAIKAAGYDFTPDEMRNVLQQNRMGGITQPQPNDAGTASIASTGEAARTGSDMPAGVVGVLGLTITP